MIPIHLASFKAAGIYRVVFDKSTVLNTDAEIMRLVVGYSEKGPFNAPTYVSSVSEFKAIYGDISKKLEKRGIYFHRTALQCLTQGPILCLNLKKFDNETVDACAINTEFNPSIAEGEELINTVKVKVEDIYDTTRFWTLDATKLAEVKDENDKGLEQYIGISATNTDKCSRSFFIRKASGQKVAGFNITVADWYNNAGEDIPEYLIGKENNLMSDFFAEIYVFNGEFTPEAVETGDLAKYFDVEETGEGEEKVTVVKLATDLHDSFGDLIDTLDALYNEPASGAISHYVGSLIPYFKDMQGMHQSLDIKFNEDVEINNLMMNFNTDLLDEGEVSIDLSARAQIDSELLGKIYTMEAQTILLGNNMATVIADKVEADSTEAVQIKEMESVYGPSVTFVAVANAEDSDKSVLSAGDCLLSTETDEETGCYKNVYVKAEADGTLVIPTNALKHESYYVRIDAPLNQEIGEMKPVFMNGYTYEHSKPVDTSMLAKQDWQDFILSALTDYKGLRIGLLNKSEIDYRYIVDSFESYVTTSCKSVLSFLAKEKQSAFAILNFPAVKTFIKCPYASFTDSKGIFNVQYVVKGCNPKKAHSKGFGIPSDSEGASFCAFYTPLKFTDGYVDNVLPSAGLVSNLFMEKYMSRQPYYIIAGPNYGAISASGLIGPDYNYSMDELQVIEPYGVNCMVYRPNFGTFINANQTAKQTPRSALSAVNVRELVIYLQDEIEKLLQSYQYEFNNQVVRNKIKDRADAICTRIQQNGGLIDFLNVMDESNNTPEIIDNEMAILSTHIEPGRGMGKMVHELTIYRTGQMRSSIVE